MNVEEAKPLVEEFIRGYLRRMNVFIPAMLLMGLGLNTS
jgi:hypothetical protein